MLSGAHLADRNGKYSKAGGGRKGFLKKSSRVVAIQVSPELKETETGPSPDEGAGHAATGICAEIGLSVRPAGIPTVC